MSRLVNYLVSRIGPASHTDIGFIVTYFERLGYITIPKPGARFRPSFYMVFVHTVLQTYNACHLLSTVTRSFRYAPECFQVVYEDITTMFSLLMGYYFQAYMGEAQVMLKTMRSFSRVDAKLVARHNYLAKLFFLVFSILVCLVAGAAVADAFTPLSPEDVEIRRRVYRVNHPERHHQYNVLIPFVDETEIPAYWFIFIWETYVNFLLAASLNLGICTLPMICLHVTAQYKILARFVEGIGKPHRDASGRRIFYTNIETNEYRYATSEEHIKSVTHIAKEDSIDSTYQNVTTGTHIRKQDSIDSTYRTVVDSETQSGTSRMHIDHLHRYVSIEEADEIRVDSEYRTSVDRARGTRRSKRDEYQRSYLKQIVRFHQKLLLFEDQLLDFLGPLMMLVVTINGVIISLCLYEVMVFSVAKIGQARYFKFAGQLVAVTLEFFLICEVSEATDEYSRRLESALIASDWTLLRDNALRRDVGLLLRRVQASNHMTFNRGLLVLNRVLFENVVKTAYSFCNFMRLGEQRK